MAIKATSALLLTAVVAVVEEVAVVAIVLRRGVYDVAHVVIARVDSVGKCFSPKPCTNEVQSKPR